MLMTKKKTTTFLVTAALAAGMIGGGVAPSLAVATEGSSSSQEQQASNVKTELLKDGDKTYKLSWNQDNDEITIMDGDKVLGKTTMSKVQESYKKEIGKIDASDSSGAAAPAVNECSATLGAVGVANSVLWAAAGMTAVAPPAAAVAGGAGVVTGAIITAGSLAC